MPAPDACVLMIVPGLTYDRKPMNVLPLVNKALTIYQWQQDLATSEGLLKEALEIDPECDSAIATLAQLTLQQGKLAEAIELFDRHAKIARTEPELEQALTFKYVSHCSFPRIDSLRRSSC